LDGSAGQNDIPPSWILLRKEKGKSWLKMSSLVMELKKKKKKKSEDFYTTQKFLHDITKCPSL